MFQRIAIVNRGEAAMRLIHAVRDLNAERPSEPQITVIALYTDAERTAMFVREADEAYPLGPASERPYLNHALLARVLTEARADAVWVGWGFVAEDAGFADLVESLGITFIGPSGDAMRKLGDKIGSKLIAEEVGVPVAPWSRGPVDSLDEALAAAGRIGYPLMLKATAGGGGRGIRRVDVPEDLTDAYQRTREEAERAFGSGVVFLEKLVTGARHVEVQVIADGQGTAWALGVRDCSVQRRNQKVIEESASPLLSPEQNAELKDSAERLALAVDYKGAGTVEFLYHPQDQFFAFLEVNTRLQVEHPITEVTNDFDLVKAQLHVAAGGRLTDRPVEQGHAVEARLNAEDPDRDFAPAPGLISRLDLPVGPGIRVDTGVAEGDSIPADFDSMIAKIIASGRTRDEALGRLRRAMSETTVIIDGGTTNKSFVLELLNRPEVIDGSADTGWIDRVRAEGGLIADRYWPVALVAAAIEAYQEVERREISHLLETARGGRPQAQHTEGMGVDLKLRGVAHRLVVFRSGPDHYRVRIGEAAADVQLERLDEAHGRLQIGAERYRIVTDTHGPVLLIEVNGITHRVSRDEGGVLRSPAPALVVATPIAVGEEVAAGAPVVVLESMKMETAIVAPFAARVRELHVMAGSQVESQAPLVRLEPLGDGQEEAETAGGEVELPPAGSDASVPARLSRLLAELSAHLMGYDTDAATDTLAAYLTARDEALATTLRPLDKLGVNQAQGSSGGPEAAASAQTTAELAEASSADILAGEIGLFALYADLAELSRNRPAGEQDNTELRIHSDREHFHGYLRSLDAARAGLPAQFVQRLERALAHYGVDSPDRTPALDEAVFRIFLAQQRVAADVQVVLAILDRWIGQPAPDAELAGPARAQLERLVRSTQRRFPAVSDVARSVRFRWFDQPQVDAEREQVLAGVAGEVADLAAHPEAPDYAARIAALSAIPERLVLTLAERLSHGITAHEPLLEVLTRKHYGDRELSGLRALTVDGRSVVVADYVLDERPAHTITTVATADELAPDGPVAAVVAQQLAAVGLAQDSDSDKPGHRGRFLVSQGGEGLGQQEPSPVSQGAPGLEAVVEVYVAWPAVGASDGSHAPLDHAQLAAQLQPQLAGWPLAGVRRIVIAACSADGNVDYATFRPDEAGNLAEDERIRGVHPMVFRRLNLWRLREFDATRLAAPRGVLLFECVAQSNPADRRLVAMAEVNQLAAVRDQNGRLIGLPHAERAVENCLEAIRRTRAARGAEGNSLDMNHVWVYVWPEIDIDLRDVMALQGKLTPLSDGTGIEEVLAEGTFVHDDQPPTRLAIRFHSKPGRGVTASVEPPPTEPLQPLDDYAAKVLRARRRGLVYPYELSETLAGPGGELVELDLDPGVAPGERDRLIAVRRPPGRNRAGIICAKVTTRTPLYPDGITRVVLSGDPTRGLGAVAEPECRRIIAALDLADELGVPVEWYTLSSGARISMDSGTENMDWVGAALRRIVEFTQAGGEINIVVAGINVGAQPYWNAEATMLMHTRGILVMTPDSAMVLTGKQSLDFSGGVSAEDNFGIGGYDRVMGPNGQAQYWAPDLAGAFRVLMGHYESTWVAPGEAGPRRAVTSDPLDRDVSSYPHEGEFATVGQIFSREHNPDRKKAFDIRTVIAAVCDADHPRTERWAGMADADTAVVIDARIGGRSVAVLGVESHPVPRVGFPPTDGPDTYTAGTLFPKSSKKAARAINAASGNRPLVVLANLSGFDGSPESMRKLQLEYGAEIGRAIVNFRGPIVFVVISRYHGGAFVVFSKRLNPNMTVLAIEGSYASVIGGAPAAAVVFAGDVAKRTAADPRVAALEARLRVARTEAKAALQLQLAEARAAVRAEKISEVAGEFDGVHDIHRAVRVGSVDRVITPAQLRPAIIETLDAWFAG